MNDKEVLLRAAATLRAQAKELWIRMSHETDEIPSDEAYAARGGAQMKADAAALEAMAQRCGEPAVWVDTERLREAMDRGYSESPLYGENWTGSLALPAQTALYTAPPPAIPEGYVLVSKAALISIAEEVELLKQDCGMDPESPRAIRNGKCMSISYAMRALAESAKEE